MMTKEEVEALMQILARVPLTQAEALWLTALLKRLAPDKSAE
jgi:hypothetical protein